MKELIRDTVFGHFLRLISHQKILPFEEDVHPDVWQRYMNKEKSGRVAHHGATSEEETGDTRYQGHQSPTSSRDSSDTQVASQDARINEIGGVVVDPEKGKDVGIVDWYSDTDPEVRLSYRAGHTRQGS